MLYVRETKTLFVLTLNSLKYGKIIMLSLSHTRGSDVSGIHSIRLLSREECDRVLSSLDENGWKIDADLAGSLENGCVRKSEGSAFSQQQLRPDLNANLLNMIADMAGGVNSDIWNFDINGFSGNEKFFVRRYASQNKSHMDWQADIAQEGDGLRKLSIIVQLTEANRYDGGDLIFLGDDIDRQAQRECGTIIIFPAYLPYRMMPVNTGIRIALVGWMRGPSFR